MDSPLDFFRRNQKTLLPVIAIGCMVAFVVLPGLLSLLDRRHQPQGDRNPVLYKWEGGDLRQAELDREIFDFQNLSYLVARVVLQRALLSGDPRVQSPDEQQRIFQNTQAQFQQVYAGPKDFTSAVDARLYDRIAEEMDVVVTDRRVNEFLDQLCGEEVLGTDGKPTGAIKTIVPAAILDGYVQEIAKRDPSFNQERMFALLQQLIRRQEVRQLLNPVNYFAAETPLARWEAYRRTQQRAAIQAIPVPVSEFVENVRQPKADEIAVFFEAYKDRLANPNSAEPGFRLPNRATFQVASIDSERLVNAFKPRIDNKAISDFYEQKKVQLFQKKQEEPKKSEETKADPTAPMTPEAKPGETKPMDSGATEAPKTEPAKTEPAKPEPDATKKQSALSRDGLLPVNFQADAKKEPAKAEPAKADPAKSEPAKAEPAKAADAAKTEPANPEPAKSEPAKTEAGKEEPAKSDAAQAKPLEFIPLAEVEEEIRKTLARQQANELAATVMNKIESRMVAHKNSRDRALRQAEEGGNAQFDQFDLAKVAGEINPDVKVETLNLVSQEKFAEHPIAKTQAMFTGIDPMTRQKGRGLRLLKEVALDEKSFPLFEPIRPTGDDALYIVWKTEQRGEEAPKLTDPGVQDQVVAAWKMVEARKEAKQQADRLAEIARTTIKADAEKAKQEAKAKEEAKPADSAKPADEAAKQADDAKPEAHGKSDEKSEAKPEDKPKTDDKPKTEDTTKTEVTAKTEEKPKTEDKPKAETLRDLYDAKVLPVAPIEIGEFSWMTLPTHQWEQQATLSNVPGLNNPGSDFMKVVFDLKQNQIGVAPNLPKTIYYVIQVTQAADLVKLNEQFLKDVRTSFGWSQYAKANFGQQNVEREVFREELRKRFKVEPTGNLPYKRQRDE